MDTRAAATPLAREASPDIGHDLVVIGASAGGLPAISALLSRLPPDLPAAVLVVLHITPDSGSMLPQIFSAASALPVKAAEDRLPLLHGEVRVAPPDQHLLVEPKIMRVVHGPRENRFRPAIDPLFRSAAWAYGSRVVGVLLSGMLNDGSAGLWAIKTCGGVAIVQDPSDARYGEMPQNALDNLSVDHCVALADMSTLLESIVGQPPVSMVIPVPSTSGIETQMALHADGNDIAGMNRIGRLSPFTCPSCHGSLWEVHDDHVLRFRCHTGHAFSADSLDTEHGDGYENALFGALRALEENASLARVIATRARGNTREQIALMYEEKAADDDRSAEVIRQLIARGGKHKRRT